MIYLYCIENIAVAMPINIDVHLGENSAIKGRPPIAIS